MTRVQHRSPCLYVARVTLCLLAVTLALSPGTAGAGASASTPRSVGQWVDSIARAERAYGEAWSVLVKDLVTGEVILEYAPDRRLLPASNRKIITAALALDRFGPEHRFRTEFGMTPGMRTPDGWLTSSLVLRSEGDPSFTQANLRNQSPTDYLRTWIAHLETLGLTRFKGAFYIDASAFGGDQQTYPDVWDYNNRHQGFAPLASAIAFNGNLVQVRAAPGSQTGQAGRITVYPDAGGLRIINNTQTAPGSIRGLHARFSPEGDTLNVGGKLGRDAGTQVVQVPLARPLDYIRAQVEAALKAERIEVLGGVHLVTDPVQAEGLQIERVLARHESPPLQVLLEEMGRSSDNFVAEQLWLAAAHRATGLGVRSNARRYEQSWLAAQGLPWVEPGYDGSGLSRRNQISAADQVAVLEELYRSPYGAYILHSLAQSGRNGTLRNRRFEASAGRVYAKTGTLSGVSALSGFVMDTESRPRWVFSMFGNARGNTNGRLTTRQNQIMKLLIDRLDGKQEASTRERLPLKRRQNDLKVHAEQPS